MRYLQADDLTVAGVFIKEHFLEAAVCEHLRHEAAVGSQAPAYISGVGGSDLLDESRRRTRRVSVTNYAQQLIEQRLRDVVPDLERWFSSQLGRMQQPQFLRYRRGDFFRAHQDSSSDARHGREVRLRKVSLVVFLNRQSRLPEPDAYCGGELTLFRVDDDPDPRLHVAGKEGLLLAFPSHVVHEVRPVTHGERYTIVTWCQGKQGEAGESEDEDARDGEAD